MHILSLTSEEAAHRVPDLSALLKDVVDGGASVGFLPPLALGEASAYWQGIVADVGAGRRRLFVALEDDAIVGSVQLYLEGRPNGNHRGEVNKLLVLTSARRRGIAKALMRTLHESATAAGRSLLVLDTVYGDHAEQLYRDLGYAPVGVIPNYARNCTGGFDPTLYMFKELGAPGAGAITA